MAGGASPESAFISAGASSLGEYGDDLIPSSNEVNVALRTVVAGAIGGTASELTGGSFVNGAVSAAFSHLFNDEYAMFRSNSTGTWSSDPQHGGARWYAWTLIKGIDLSSLLGGYYGPWQIERDGTNLCFECMSNWQELTGAPDSKYLFAGPYLKDIPLLRQGVMIAWAQDANWNSGTGSYPSASAGNHTALVMSNGTSLTFYHVFAGHPLTQETGNSGFNQGRAPGE